MGDAEPAFTGRGTAATAALAETWESLAGVCRGLPVQEWHRPTGCPGWSVQDHLSHLIGIERALSGESTPTSDDPLGDHVRTPFAEENERWIAVRRSSPGPDVLTEFVAVTQRRLATLRRLTEDEWARVGPTIVGEVALADFMKTRVFDSWVHEQDVRLALGRPGGCGGLASAIGVGQVEAAMGFVVGKKAAAPEGSVVRFSVTGPGRDARRITLAVQAGRARPAADGGPPHGDPDPFEPRLRPPGLRSGLDGAGGGGRRRGGGGGANAALGKKILGVHELHVLIRPVECAVRDACHH